MYRGDSAARVDVIGVRCYSSTDLANWRDEGLSSSPRLHLNSAGPLLSWGLCAPSNGAYANIIHLHLCLTVLKIQVALLCSTGCAAPQCNVGNLASADLKLAQIYHSVDKDYIKSPAI